MSCIREIVDQTVSTVYVPGVLENQCWCSNHHEYAPYFSIIVAVIQLVRGHFAINAFVLCLSMYLKCQDDIFLMEGEYVTWQIVCDSYLYIFCLFYTCNHHVQYCVVILSGCVTLYSHLSSPHNLSFMFHAVLAHTVINPSMMNQCITIHSSVRENHAFILLSAVPSAFEPLHVLSIIRLFIFICLSIERTVQ